MKESKKLKQKPKRKVDQESEDENEIKKQKIKKQKSEISNENISAEEDEDEEIREPTLAELKESEKPEYSYSVPSIRAQQKQKHEKIVEQKKKKSKEQNKTAIETYLTTWNDDRTNWKYKKLMQVEIVARMFDEEIITEKFWPIVVHYLSGSEGKAKTKIIEQAESEISKLDEQIEKGQKNLTKSMLYLRARELLQRLN